MRIPSYRLHKPSKLAVVTLDGKAVYMGRFGTKESRDKYRELIAEWLTQKGQAVPASHRLSAKKGRILR